MPRPNPSTTTEQPHPFAPPIFPRLPEDIKHHHTKRLTLPGIGIGEEHPYLQRENYLSSLVDHPLTQHPDILRTQAETTRATLVAARKAQSGLREGEREKAQPGAQKVKAKGATMSYAEAEKEIARLRAEVEVYKTMVREAWEREDNEEMDDVREGG